MRRRSASGRGPVRSGAPGPFVRTRFLHSISRIASGSLRCPSTSAGARVWSALMRLGAPAWCARMSAVVRPPVRRARRVPGVVSTPARGSPAPPSCPAIAAGVETTPGTRDRAPPESAGEPCGAVRSLVRCGALSGAPRCALWCTAARSLVHRGALSGAPGAIARTRFLKSRFADCLEFDPSLGAPDDSRPGRRSATSALRVRSFDCQGTLHGDRAWRSAGRRGPQRREPRPARTRSEGVRTKNAAHPV